MIKMTFTALLPPFVGPATATGWAYVVATGAFETGGT
jgi:hypothetical protein